MIGLTRQDCGHENVKGPASKAAGTMVDEMLNMRDGFQRLLDIRENQNQGRTR
jgi:hypothetical protein